MKSAVWGLAAFLAAGLTSAAWAQGFKPTQKSAEAELSFEGGTGLSNYTLSVSGPNGFYASVSSPTAVPSLNLRQLGAFDDGLYTYDISAMTSEKVSARTQLYEYITKSGEKVVVKGPLDNGREGARAETQRGVSASGVFQVKNGAIQPYDEKAIEKAPSKEPVALLPRPERK